MAKFSPNFFRKRRINNSPLAYSQYRSDKVRYVKWKIDLLNGLERDEEAEKVITQHLDMEEIAALRYDELIDDGLYDEAKAFCKSRLDSGKDRWNNVQTWHERLIDLGRRTDDKDTVRETARWLFAHGNVRQEDKKNYFHICRESVAEDQWPAYRDKLFKEGKTGGVGTDIMCELYKEEQLFDRLFLYLKELPANAGYTPYAPYHNVGGERMLFFSRYARYLTDVQCADMVNDFTETIRQQSRYACTRDSYAQVASGLHLLSQSCEIGRKQARLLAAQILRENPSKPAYREEINSYEY